MKIQFQVQEKDNIISFFSKHNYSKNKVKTLVKLGLVYVNNEKIKLPYTVSENDLVTIKDEEQEKDFGIIYEDKNYLVVNKEAGMLTISTSSKNKDKEITLYKLVREYLNKKKELCFIVNRIDKETSGLVIFAKNLKLKEKLQSDWNNIVKERLYIAVVDGIIKKDGRIDNYLYEDKMTFSHSTNKGGKRAITNYKIIKQNKEYTMLDVNIETGRKNQIRVHMTEMNHPIAGDKKYKCLTNPIKRLCLHHYRISLIDPISKKLLTFESKIPNEFNKIFKTSN